MVENPEDKFSRDEAQLCLLSKYFRKRPSMFKFIELLCTDNKKTTRKLSMYVEKAFRIRKETYAKIITIVNIIM